jgi:hypothetical protein
MFRSRRPRVALITVALATLTTCTVSTYARAMQIKRSTIIAGIADRDTGEPLSGAEIVLVDLDRAARANALGEAILTGVPAGRTRLRVRRIGYAPIETELAVAGDTTGAVFRLERVPAKLAEVVVEVDRLSPAMRDVAERRRQGFGRYLDAADLAAEGTRPFAFVAAYRFPGLLLLPGTKPILGSARPELSPSGMSYCPVDVYVDDQYIGVNDQDTIRTQDLEIMEFYTAARVPVKYRTRTYKCGVLLLWSKQR